MRALSSPAALVILLLALGSLRGWTAPGTITLTVSEASVTVSNRFTLSVGISGYTGPVEIDGYNFRILYDPARFAVISDSASLHDAAGPAQNWLRFPAQENVTGPSQLNDWTLFDQGLVHVAVFDLRLAPNPLNPRGTAAEAGFLYELAFTALTPGTGAITVAPAAGNVLLHDAFLNAAGVPALEGTSANVTVTAPRLQIERTGLNQVTITWSEGILETTDRLGAAWAPVLGATNSLTVRAVGGQRFYRAVAP